MTNIDCAIARLAVVVVVGGQSGWFEANARSNSESVYEHYVVLSYDVSSYKSVKFRRARPKSIGWPQEQSETEQSQISSLAKRVPSA